MNANDLKYSQDYVDAQQAEIERLRDSLVIANTTQANLHSEIDKLRELLRDGLVGTDPRWMTTDAGREWLLRVSEALGE